MPYCVQAIGFLYLSLKMRGEEKWVVAIPRCMVKQLHMMVSVSTWELPHFSARSYIHTSHR